MHAGPDNMPDTLNDPLAIIKMSAFNIAKVRRDFPLLSLRVNSKPLIYLDNAATTQKPRVVIDALNQFYKVANANVHRGAHSLSNNATSAYEQARSTVATFINATATKEIIWCSGTTDAINLVANSLSAMVLNQGDCILVSVSEHHANIVPWQQAAIVHGAHVIAVPLRDDLSIDLEQYALLLEQHRPKIVALAHVSNALGTIHPIKQMIAMAQQHGALTLIDGAQAISHLKVDVQQLNCDFYCFSAHKCFGPTGIGVLWGRYELLDKMPVWKTGGEMIKKVSFTGTSFNALPFKFEAGTPPIGDAIAFCAALQYLNNLDSGGARSHEQHLTNSLINALKAIPQVTLYSPSRNNAGVVSFSVEDLHHQDLAALLDQEGIAVRSGHHCAMPLMEALGIEGTLRASLCFYNTEQEIEAFVHALKQSIALLSEKTTNHINNSEMPSAQLIEYPDSAVLIQTLKRSKTWQKRFSLLMSLGDLLPAPDASLICECYQLQQCESGVWLQKMTNENHTSYLAWSDARIMRGLIVFLISCKVAALADIDRLLQEVKLSAYLSPSRTNGVKAIIAAL